MHADRRFHRDFGCQFAVSHGFRRVVALPSPVFEMNSRLLPLNHFSAKNLLEVFREFRGIGAFHLALEDGGVPYSMQIGREIFMRLMGPAPEVLNRHTVPAKVVVSGGMQRHVQITDKVDHIPEGFSALAWFGMSVF